ncbi:MAG TPA: tubulin-like doman-containing protein [Thermoanaerobaculia bacterium]|jgi:hypothetical protein
MTRYAPTLFVGLGGSGIKVLRWVKTRMCDGRGESVLEHEPVAFLGIDFDPFSNNAAGPLLRLGDDEFHYFAAPGIAEQVNHLDRERPELDSSDDGPERPAAFEFEEVREWYPDPEQRAIRYAQSEATGAAQWRPLGRIGFYLYDRKITEALSLALTMLDDKRAHSARLGEQPTVMLVSSLSGGTGSSILFDVAVAIRKIRRGITVRAVLLLPEIFEHVDFRDRVVPNAYATLWEIANLKNQHVVFNARYPRIPPVTVSDSPPPFQRVYVLGPWMGDRRPFVNPDEAYPHLGDLLRLTITREIRAAALTSEANAAADTGAPLGSPTSRDVFCTMSAMGIRLLRYCELADLVVRRFLEELEPRGPRPTIEMFASTPKDETRHEIVQWITNAANGGDSKFSIDRGFMQDRIRTMLASELRYGEVWSPERLQKLVDTVHRFIGTDTSMSRKEPPEIAATIRTRFRDALRERLEELRQTTYARSPRAFEALLQDLEHRIPEPRSRRVLPAVEFLDSVPRWLTGRTLPLSFTQGITPPHLANVRAAIAEWARVTPEETDLKTWAAQAVLAGARDAIVALREAEETFWSFVGGLKTLAEKKLSNAGSERDPEAEHLMLDSRRGDVRAALRAELDRIGADRRQAFIDLFLGNFDRFYRDFAASRATEPRLFDEWIKQTQTLFERELSVVDREKDPNEPARNYRFVAPEALFTPDEVKLALFRLGTRIFQPGRVQARATARLARLLIPHGFAHRDAFEKRLKSWCRGLLGANASSTSEESQDVEDRIVVVLDDLFHPAEELSGIYDYHAQYAAQPDPTLFHIHKDWPREFAPLITRAGNRSPVHCGNRGCRYDLRFTPRTTLFCPGCERPIQNRCGNSRCVVDDLASRPDAERRKFIESRACPGCRRPLRTYFWECSTHGQVPMDKESCPSCVLEGRPEEEIARRPDRASRYTCPSCVTRGLADPFTARGDLARFLRDGVNGHDSLIAEKLFAEHLHADGRCPRCGTHLVPFCPERNAETPRLHYLHRRSAARDGRFRCYAHTAMSFLTCGKCQFPVEPEETRCKRCGVDLEDCRFCTPERHLRIPKANEPDAPCPSCSLRRIAPRHHERGTLAHAEGSALFCSNLYGCPAGARLDEATFPPGTHHCRVCEDRDLPLLMARTRDHHLSRCWVCRESFGRSFDVPSNDVKTKPAEGSASPAKCPERNPPAMNTYCCLCGFGFELTQDFARHTSADTDAGSDGADEELKMGRLFVLIARTLRCTRTTEDAFRCLMGKYFELARERFEDYLICFAQRIERKAVLRVAGPRIDAILQLYRSQLRCGDPKCESGETARCDCR